MKLKFKAYYDFTPKSFHALKNYSWNLFKSDLLAGLAVGVVALPLAMAFAIASGVSPEKGLYTAIIAGFLISLLGGSQLQIGGPTGAFVVIIYGVIAARGYDGLVLATLIAGALLLVAAFSRLGNLIKYIPYPVITGFTTGIAVIIFSSQVKDFFGMKIDHLSADFVQLWHTLLTSLPTLDPTTLYLGAGSLLLIILLRRFLPVFPWAIGAVLFATLLTWSFDLPVDTISSRFGKINASFPIPTLPDFSDQWRDWKGLLSDALIIAFLAGVESLLSAVVADGMAGTRHKPNCELMAQGVANIGSVLFGGIPATGAIARTATNIKTGGKTPVSGMIHAATLFLILLFFAPIVGHIPLCSLAAILFMVAWNMSEYERFLHLFRAPLGDRIVLLTTCAFTIFVNLTVAIGVGMVLAFFLFAKRMGELTKIRALTPPKAIDREKLPHGVELYEINGPFFFGIADSVKTVLSNLEFRPKVFILHLQNVPLIDASGMVALLDVYDKCHREKTTLLLSGISAHLLQKLKHFGVIEKIGKNHLYSSLEKALAAAKRSK